MAGLFACTTVILAAALDLTVLLRGTFQRALDRAEHWLKKTPPSQVLMVDVAAARALRIYPIPSPERQGERGG